MCALQRAVPSGSIEAQGGEVGYSEVREVRERPRSGTREELEQRLRSVDGRGYPAYKTLEGTYELPSFTLFVDHVQGDPFAAPSRLRARVSQRLARFPPDLYNTPLRRVALADFLARRFAAG